jgi:hypothetical protein
VLWDGDSRLEKLTAIEDSEELCRQLLASPGGWGSSTSHVEAVEMLGKVHGTGELPGSFVALMLCTCRRWDRVTARLIAAIEDSGLLDDADLDELADWFLAHEHVISYPLAWVSPQWLEVDLSDWTSRTCTVDEDTLAHHRLSFEPPLRRWGARRALLADRSWSYTATTRARVRRRDANSERSRPPGRGWRRGVPPELGRVRSGAEVGEAQPGLRPGGSDDRDAERDVV